MTAKRGITRPHLCPPSSADAYRSNATFFKADSSTIAWLKDLQMWAERWAIGRGCRDSAKFFFHLHPSNSLMSLHLHCVDARQIWQQSRSELEVGTDETDDTGARALLPGFVAHAHKTVELEVVITQLELEARLKGMARLFKPSTWGAYTTLVAYLGLLAVLGLFLTATGGGEL